MRSSSATNKSRTVMSTMAMLVLLSLLLLAASPASAAINVVNTTPPDGTIVKEGHTVRLSCRTDVRWFFCLWKSPGKEKSCAIQQNRTPPQSVCQADRRINMDPGATSCDIVVSNVQAADHGSWMCLVNEIDEFESRRREVRLEVGRAATVRFEPGFGSRNELKLTEGEEAKIRCAAFDGHPAATISWEEPTSKPRNGVANNRSPRSDKPRRFDASALQVIQRDDNSHTTTVFHTVVYKADLEDDGKEITCLATQIDHDGRTVLYESSTSLRLRVEKLVLPVDNALTQKIGIISGVLLAIIFLILLLIFCIVVVCKRCRKRRKRSTPSRPPSSHTISSTNTSPDQTLKPIWTTKKSGGVGGTTGPIVSEGRTASHPVDNYSDLLDGNNRGLLGHQNGSASSSAPMVDVVNGTAVAVRPAGSKGSVSTRSTTSQNSWEENRSVGGEVEVETPMEIVRSPDGAKSPSLHETHFEDDSPPRTVLHHPDPYQQQVQQLLQQHRDNNPPQQQQPSLYQPHHPHPLYATPHRPSPLPNPQLSLSRPGSSAADPALIVGLPAAPSPALSGYSPYGTSQHRPYSAMSQPLGALSGAPPSEAGSSTGGGFGLPPSSALVMGLPSGSTPLPRPMTAASNKSVFECDNGCFDLRGDRKKDCPHSGSSCSSSRSNSMDSNKQQQQQQDKISPARTSEPRDV